MLCARYVHASEYVTAFTLLASSSYVLAGLLAGGLRTWYGRLCLTGLVFCWLGDVVGPGSFVAGLYAFLFAHLSFSASFFTRGMDWKRVGLAVLPILVGTTVTGLMLWPNVEAPEHVPFVLYSTVISIMVILAAGVSRSDRLAFAAALVFYVSDILVARWRYGGGHWEGYVCYILYYTSCILFAHSAWPRPLAGEADAER